MGLKFTLFQNTGSYRQVESVKLYNDLWLVGTMAYTDSYVVGDPGLWYSGRTKLRKFDLYQYLAIYIKKDVNVYDFALLSHLHNTNMTMCHFKVFNNLSCFDAREQSKHVYRIYLPLLAQLSIAHAWILIHVFKSLCDSQLHVNY